MSETTRQRYARTAIARLQKKHGGEYAVVDFCSEQTSEPALI